MAKPTAYFGYSKEGLTVSFNNLSLKSPTNYSWDFGDGSAVDVTKNPTHIYAEPGFYSVSLTVTNSDGEDTLSITVGVGDSNDMMNASIMELVDYYIPTLLLGELDSTEKVSLIIKWQLYLQPLIETPYEVSLEHTHNEMHWPGLANSLIAQLVSYDIILQGANQFLSFTTREGSSEDQSEGEDTTLPKKIKSIETGPAKTEWYENKTSEDLKNIAAAMSSAMSAGGAMDLLKESICQQAGRLRIYLPMCGQLAHKTIAPRVTPTLKRGKHNANPFGVTKRMT